MKDVKSASSRYKMVQTSLPKNFPPCLYVCFKSECMNIYAAIYAILKIGESFKSLRIKMLLSLFGWICQIIFAGQLA